jgi:hypothetical protein
MQDEKGNNSANDGSSEGTTQNGEEDIIPAKREALIGVIEIIGGIVFGGIAVALSDAGFHIWGFFFGFLSVGCGLVILTHLVEKLGFKYVKTLLATLVISDLILFAFLAWHTFSIEKSSAPKPHFTLSLQTRDFPEAIVALTNDCLFRPGMVNVITNLSNGSLFFRGIASGCVVIPVRDGESNTVFRFIAENDSSVNVNDLVISAGFPDFGKIGLDSTKWQEVREHMTVPGWRLQIKNMQFWAARIPWPLVAGDSFAFSEITNFSIPEWDNPSNNMGLFKLLIRSTGFEQQLGANLFFIPVPTNVMFKPFVTEMRLGKDGLWSLDLSSNGLENLPK